MNSGQRRTLRRIFTKPTPSDIRWDDILGLLEACGATVQRRGGSPVRVSYGARTAVFHSPHPSNQTSRGRVEAVADFIRETMPERLKEVGIDS